MFKLRILLAICFLLKTNCARCEDGISLDKLSDCQGLATLRSALNGPPSRNCRTVRNHLETLVMSQLASIPDAKTCLMSSPPVSGLSGFSCFDMAFKLGRELTCFRPVDKMQLDNYIDTYDSNYRERVVEYLKVAARCPVGNGDATAAPNSLFPPLLNSIARARFGFVLQIGNERNSQIYHAYADLNPDIDSSKAGAIEVIDFIKNVKETIIPPPACAGKEGITVNIDNSPDVRKTVENSFRQQYGARAVVKTRFVTLTYCGSENIPTSTKKNDLDEWLDQLKYELAVTDYREMEPEDFRGTPFRSVDDMREIIARNMPFGQRNSNRTIGPHLLVMVDDSHPQQCVATAEAMVLEPEENVKSDYGSVGLVFIGLGDCRTAQKANGTLSDQLLEKLIEDLKSSAVK